VWSTQAAATALFQGWSLFLGLGVLAEWAPSGCKNSFNG